MLTKETAIKLLPEKIQQAVKSDDINQLKKLVIEELNRCEYSFENRAMIDTPVAHEVMVRVAALSFWLQEEGRLEDEKTLAYWCWSHHPAWELMNMRIALFSEPIRGKKFREIYQSQLATDEEIFKLCVAPALKIWYEQAGIILEGFVPEEVAA